MTSRVAFKMAIGVGVALLPIAAFLWLFFAQEIPIEVQRASLDLGGDWRLLAGDRSDGASPDLDDNALPIFRVPGGITEEGFFGDQHWLRRRFELPERLRGQNLFLTLGGTRSGIADLYLNGKLFARTALRARGSKTELNGREGWDVPAELLRPGENLLALHFVWQWPGVDGIHEATALLGPLSLKQAFLSVTDVRRFLLCGSACLMVFLAVLFTFMLGAEGEHEARLMYMRCIALLLSATLYLSTLAGVFFALSLGWKLHLPIIFLSITLVCMAWFDFIGNLLLGKGTRLIRWSRRIYGVLIAMQLVTAIFQRPPELLVLALVINHVVSILFVLILFIQGTQGLITKRIEVDTLSLSAIFIFLVTGLTDLLKDLGLMTGTRLFPIGVMTGAILAAIILIARFTRISFVHQELSFSLKRTNGELADALVKAQEASRLKSEFVANVSHELRTPLNSVLNIPEGLLEYFEPAPGARCEACSGIFELEQGEVLAADAACPACDARGRLVSEDTFRFRGESGAVVRSLQQIHRAGDHLLNLINDVLDFSRLEAGRMVLKLEPLDVATALTHVLETIEPISRPRHVTLTLEAVAGLPLVCDSVKFSQIFLNLVGNAVKFSPENGEVKVGGEHRDGKWVLWVKDQGIGIAAENHEIIFESFRQVDGSNTRKYGGTGLGLAITRKLAEAHGGRVWVESTLQQGSTFYVELPLEGPLVKAEEATADGPVSSVLLLDDEPLALDNLKAALRPLRHRIYGITSPLELDRALEQIKPDLLVLDVMMPGVSGLDILKRLKARRLSLPILVSSAYHANREVVEVLGAAWLSKPWRGDVLRAEVTRLLRAGQDSQEGPRRVAS